MSHTYRLFILPKTHRLLPFSLRNTDTPIFHFHTYIQNKDYTHSLRHTNEPHSNLYTQTTSTHSDKQTSLIVTYTHSLFSFSLKQTEYSRSHSDTQTTPIFTHTYIIQTTLILTQTHWLLPFSLRSTNYFNSHSDTQTTPILTKTPRLLSFSLGHSDYFASQFQDFM